MGKIAALLLKTFGSWFGPILQLQVSNTSKQYCCAGSSVLLGRCCIFNSPSRCLYATFFVILAWTVAGEAGQMLSYATICWAHPPAGFAHLTTCCSRPWLVGRPVNLLHPTTSGRTCAFYVLFQSKLLCCCPAEPEDESRSFLGLQ